MGSYKYLHRFQIINCAECESTDQLTVNEYTDEVLCLVCLNEQIELEEGKELSKEDIEAIKGDELRQRMKDE